MESAMQGAKSGCDTLNMFHAFEQLGDALSAMDNFTEAIRYYQKMVCDVSLCISLYDI